MLVLLVLLNLFSDPCDLGAKMDLKGDITQCCKLKTHIIFPLFLKSENFKSCLYELSDLVST